MNTTYDWRYGAISTSQLAARSDDKSDERPTSPEKSRAKDQYKKPASQPPSEVMGDSAKNGGGIYGFAHALRFLEHLEDEGPHKARIAETGVGEASARLAKSDRVIPQKSEDASPADGYGRWRPYLRMYQKRNGAGASLDPLYRNCYAEVGGDGRLFQSIQVAIQASFWARRENAPLLRNSTIEDKGARPGIRAEKPIM